MESSLEDGNSCCRFIRTLEKNVGILQEEAGHGLHTITPLENKVEWFKQVSTSLSDKLSSLHSLAQRRGFANSEIAEFAEQISNAWTNATKQICKKYSGIRVASRTVPGVPLTVLLDKVKKEIIAAKLSLRVGVVPYCKEHATSGGPLFKKLANMLNSLERCDNKIQQYLAISKITPYLMQLECAVDQFVAGVELVSVRNTASTDLTAFTVAVKLLTGELLGQECMNPHQVLAENAPKKPIFIIKNNKRRMEIPTLADVKTSKPRLIPV